MTTEQSYQAHRRGEAGHKGVHPDGCWYCGGDHPTDTCNAEERRAAEERE